MQTDPENSYGVTQGGVRTVLAFRCETAASCSFILISRPRCAVHRARSPSSRPSPIRPLSPSRTPGCSRNSRKERDLTRPWSSRPRPATSWGHLELTHRRPPVFDTSSSALPAVRRPFADAVHYDGELIDQVAEHDFSPEGRGGASSRLPPDGLARVHSGRRSSSTLIGRDIPLDADVRSARASRAMGYRADLRSRC